MQNGGFSVLRNPKVLHVLASSDKTSSQRRTSGALSLCSFDSMVISFTMIVTFTFCLNFS